MNLARCAFAPRAGDAEAGPVNCWTGVERGMLVQQLQDETEAQAAEDGDGMHVEPPVASTSREAMSPVRRTPGRPRGRKSLAPPPLPTQLDRLLALQDADVVRLSVWLPSSPDQPPTPPNTDESIVLRVHFIPDDLLERSMAVHQRLRTVRPGVATVLSGFSMVRMNNYEWRTGSVGAGEKGVMDEEASSFLLWVLVNED